MLATIGQLSAQNKQLLMAAQDSSGPRRLQSQLRAANKKHSDLQAKHLAKIEKARRLEEQVKRLEAEKLKLSEKWMRLSYKNKHEDKLRVRIKELEASHQSKDSEVRTCIHSHRS